VAFDHLACRLSTLATTHIDNSNYTKATQWELRRLEGYQRGANNAAAQSLLKQDYKEDCDLKEACAMAVKVLSKTMDSTRLSSEKSEYHPHPLAFRNPAMPIQGAD